MGTEDQQSLAYVNGRHWSLTGRGTEKRREERTEDTRSQETEGRKNKKRKRNKRIGRSE